MRYVALSGRASPSRERWPGLLQPPALALGWWHPAASPLKATTRSERWVLHQLGMTSTDEPRVLKRLSSSPLSGWGLSFRYYWGFSTVYRPIEQLETDAARAWVVRQLTNVEETIAGFRQTYRVATPDDLAERIRKGLIEGHPAWEDTIRWALDTPRSSRRCRTRLPIELFTATPPTATGARPP